MNEAIELCNEIQNRSHQPAGPVYKNLCKRHALECFKIKDDMKGIYSLSESHAPTYRIKTTYRYDKLLASADNQELTMNKEFISFNCPVDYPEGIAIMLNKVEELPEEWTLIQITTRFDLNESKQLDISKTNTDALHITMFNCGQKQIKPFYVNVRAPKDISGAKIELCKEMHLIIEENKHLLTNCFGPDIDLKKVTQKQKKIYSERRSALNNRLKDVINVIEKTWISEFRCLFVGKFIDENAATKIFDNFETIVNNFGYNMSKETQYLFHKIIAGSEYLTGSEILRAVSYCIPDNKDLRIKIYKEVMNISSSFKFKKMKRHPVILIIDEKLDCFPWEMIDVLIDQPVSRIPSLHFAYALYKEHESTIINGFKQIKSNGSYIINPNLDLKKMEARLTEFFKYWLPDWKGIIGQKPDSEQFSNFLTKGDIFIYNGHGSGTQFLSANKIQQMRVESVVLLFGCSSIRMSPMGSFVEMYDIFHNYLIACSPCVVGMIWEVTDFDTDILSTSMLSHWIPSKADLHWKMIDKVKWEKGAITPISSVSHKQKSTDIDWEPELLRAINIAKNEPVQFLTKCAIIARGLPIKIV